MNLATLFIGEPDHTTIKTSDLLDFDIIKGIPKDYCRTESYLEVSSDHFSVIFTINSKIMTKVILAIFAMPKQNGSISKS